MGVHFMEHTGISLTNNMMLGCPKKYLKIMGYTKTCDIGEENHDDMPILGVPSRWPNKSVVWWLPSGYVKIAIEHDH